jgi:hypothetical protein
MTPLMSPTGVACTQAPAQVAGLVARTKLSFAHSHCVRGTCRHAKLSLHDTREALNSATLTGAQNKQGAYLPCMTQAAHIIFAQCY